MIKWLIKKIVELLKNDCDFMYELRNDIKVEVSKHIVEVIKHSFDNTYKFNADFINMYDGWALENIKNALVIGVNSNYDKIAKEQIDKISKAQNTYINSEEFIDKIITRINTKQLNN